MSTLLEKHLWSEQCFGLGNRDELDITTDFLYNSANLKYVPNIYRSILGRATEIIENGSEQNLQERYSAGKIGALANAVRFSLELVGLRLHLTDSADYIGSLGISPTINKVYGIDDYMKVELGVLSLYPKVEEDLPSLSLRMHRNNAKMLLGPEIVEEAKGDVIEPVRINLLTKIVSGLPQKPLSVAPVASPTPPTTPAAPKPIGVLPFYRIRQPV